MSRGHQTSFFPRNVALHGLVGQDNMGNDLLMGHLDLTPVLDDHVCARPSCVVIPVSDQ
jgi:hypothetical protein